MPWGFLKAAGMTGRGTRPETKLSLGKTVTKASEDSTYHPPAGVHDGVSCLLIF